MDTATKTEIDVAKNASKKSCLKKEEATEKLVANKTGGKIISAGSTKKKKKKKKKEDGSNEIQKIYIPPEKLQQTIDTLRFF